MGWGLLLGAPSPAQSPGPPAILGAEIEERSPIGTDVAARSMIFRIQLASLPVCGPSADFLSFGFLIDSDRNRATGVTALLEPGFDGLGVDARIGADCDPASGLFQSPAGGHVRLIQDAGSPRIEIELLGRLLPAVHFHWIAYVLSDGELVRFPKAPDSEAWAISEISRF